MVKGVLTSLINCMVEQLKQGTKVNLNGLGMFYVTLEATGAESAVNYNLSKRLKAVHIRFSPERSQTEWNGALSSRKLVEKVNMKQNMIYDMNGVPKRVVNGELVNYGSSHAEEPEDEPQGSSGT